MACIFMTEETLEELVPLHLAAIELANLRSDLGIKDCDVFRRVAQPLVIYSLHIITGCSAL